MGKWNCYVCTKEITYNELFTFTSKGAVHFRCFRDEALKDRDATKEILLEMLEKELEMITNYKKYINNASEKAKELLEANEKDAEKHAALLTKLIDEGKY
jgi:hypothetical protein